MSEKPNNARQPERGGRAFNDVQATLFAEASKGGHLAGGIDGSRSGDRWV